MGDVSVGIQVNITNGALITQRLFVWGARELNVQDAGRCRELASRCWAAAGFFLGTLTSGLNVLWHGLCATAFFILGALLLIWTPFARLFRVSSAVSSPGWAGVHLVEQIGCALTSTVCVVLGLFLTLSAFLDFDRERVASRIVVDEHTFDHGLEKAWTMEQLTDLKGVTDLGHAIKEGERAPPPLPGWLAAPCDRGLGQAVGINDLAARGHEAAMSVVSSVQQYGPYTLGQTRYSICSVGSTGAEGAHIAGWDGKKISPEPRDCWFSSAWSLNEVREEGWGGDAPSSEDESEGEYVGMFKSRR